MIAYRPKEQYYMTMAPTLFKKRKLEDAVQARVARPSKKARKQTAYLSGSSSPSPSPTTDEFNPADLADTSNGLISSQNKGQDDNKVQELSSLSPSKTSSASESDSDSIASSHSDSNPNLVRIRTKRHDPATFATSLQKILSTKLTTSKRVDPVLARSKSAQLASQELNEGKLEAKAKRVLREEKRVGKEKGRVKDVLLGDRKELGGLMGSGDDPVSTTHGATKGTGEIEATSGISAATIAEQERRLRKTAQRGVVKLFNAVRAAQVKAEEAAREVRKIGVVGVGRREEKVSQMSKEGFLELVAGGGGSGGPAKRGIATMEVLKT